MFDTHAHLNFKRFNNRVDECIQSAFDASITHIVIPGTDITSSQKAIDIASKYERIYAAIGIHPHHVYKYLKNEPKQTTEIAIKEDLVKLEQMIGNSNVIAIGEVGMDRHMYGSTKYDSYTVTEEFLHTQQKLLKEQIRLATNNNKTLILHNREAVDDILDVLSTNWSEKLANRTVFHCCEANDRLLAFTQEFGVFIGVDGDVTYDKTKQAFIKKVPLNKLVVETDSPYILPEPLKSRKEYPNEPKNLHLIVKKIAEIKDISLKQAITKTTNNAKTLFDL